MSKMSCNCYKACVLATTKYIIFRTTSHSGIQNLRLYSHCMDISSLIIFVFVLNLFLVMIKVEVYCIPHIKQLHQY